MEMVKKTFWFYFACFQDTVLGQKPRKTIFEKLSSFDKDDGDGGNFSL